MIELEEKLRYEGKRNDYVRKMYESYITLQECTEQALYNGSASQVPDCVQQFQKKTQQEGSQSQGFLLQFTLDHLQKSCLPFSKNPLITAGDRKIRLLSYILFANFFFISIIIAFLLEKKNKAS